MVSGPDAPMFAPALVRCIGDGRDPSVDELFTVARQIWAEGQQERSAFAWDRLAPAHPDKVGALRMAQASLSGSADRGLLRRRHPARRPEQT